MDRVVKQQISSRLLAVYPKVGVSIEQTSTPLTRDFSGPVGTTRGKLP